MENLGAESGVQTPLSMYSTTVSIGDAELSTTMDVSFFSHFHNWNAVPHQHSYHELFFLAEGFCSLRVGAAAYQFVKNDLIWIPQGAIHYVSHVEESTRLYSMGVCVAERPARGGTRGIYSGFLELSQRSAPFHRLSDAEETIALMQRVRIELSRKRFGFVEQTNAYLALLYLSLLRKSRGIPADGQAAAGMRDLDVDSSALGPESRRQYDEMVVNVWFFRHYKEKFTISDVARSLNMSISQTNRFIKQLYGIGFAQKLSQVRMSVAQNLLLKTDWPAEQIAEAVGYQSYKGFFAAFKKQTLQSPAAYRRSGGAQGAQTREVCAEPGEPKA